MIYLDSRYADGALRDVYDETNGSYQLTVFRRFPYSTGVYYNYEWVSGDRIDVIALRFLGDQKKWWSIMDFNPEVLNPMDIKPGTILRIPVVE